MQLNNENSYVRYLLSYAALHLTVSLDSHKEQTKECLEWNEED